MSVATYDVAAGEHHLETLACGCIAEVPEARLGDVVRCGWHQRQQVVQVRGLVSVLAGSAPVRVQVLFPESA